MSTKFLLQVFHVCWCSNTTSTFTAFVSMDVILQFRKCLWQGLNGNMFLDSHKRKSNGIKSGDLRGQGICSACTIVVTENLKEISLCRASHENFTSEFTIQLHISTGSDFKDCSYKLPLLIPCSFWYHSLMEFLNCESFFNFIHYCLCMNSTFSWTSHFILQM
jgi:hypothetical protein